MEPLPPARPPLPSPLIRCGFSALACHSIAVDPAVPAATLADHPTFSVTAATAHSAALGSAAPGTHGAFVRGSPPVGQAARPYPLLPWVLTEVRCPPGPAPPVPPLPLPLIATPERPHLSALTRRRMSPFRARSSTLTHFSCEGMCSSWGSPGGNVPQRTAPYLRCASHVPPVGYRKTQPKTHLFVRNTSKFDRARSDTPRF